MYQLFHVISLVIAADPPALSASERFKQYVKTIKAGDAGVMRSANEGLERDRKLIESLNDMKKEKILRGSFIKAEPVKPGDAEKVAKYDPMSAEKLKTWQNQFDKTIKVNREISQNSKYLNIICT
jgi:hypothetical protein